MNDQHFTLGSDNAYKDLGYENPEEMQRKSILIHALNLLIKQARISEYELKIRLGISLDHLKSISNGKFFNISENEIVGYIERLKSNNPSK